MIALAGHYAFWLAAISLACFLLERVRPWRREQRTLRPGFAQDLAWLVWNGHFAGLAVAWVAGRILDGIGRVAGGGVRVPELASVELLRGAPLVVQFVVLLVVKDFLEWCIHNLLHRVPWLWEFHKVHHSIEALDFLGNFRFHWMEIVVYRGLTYLPLVVLGVDGRVILAVAVAGTLIGHLNHANVNVGWGPLRYVLNSPRMHVWHHELVTDGSAGRNFGVVFSVWDFLFGTAWLPRDGSQPARLGFRGIERFPTSFARRLVHPLASRAGSTRAP